MTDHDKLAEATLELSVRELLSGVREMLGAKLAAYIAGVKTTSQISRWIAEESPALTEGQLRRLRLAYVVAAALVNREGKVTTQSWFMGMNPTLANTAPARFIVETDGRDSASVMAALFDMH